eukprot:c3235_g1_i2.p1 GENE.c3235_g1_i2~~c3235_g1_i2.p1  ORF type:complete len:132 (-),score=24.76 c3235_g1_i2:45-440(-)
MTLEKRASSTVNVSWKNSRVDLNKISSSKCFNSSLPASWQLLCPAVKGTRQYYNGECLSSPRPLIPCGRATTYFTVGWISLVMLSSFLLLYCLRHWIRTFYRTIRRFSTNAANNNAVINTRRRVVNAENVP